MSRLASSPTGVPPPLSRDARRGPTTTPTRAAAPAAAVTTHGGGVVVVRHADPSSPSALRGPPLRGRMDIAQPNLVSAVALRDHIAQSLGVPSDEVSVTPETTAIATVDFTVSNARHLYPDDAAVARALSADIRLRMNLNKLLRVHNAGAFTFVLREPHVSDRAWSSVTASNFFELVDAGLVAAVDACGASEGDALDALDSTIRIAFAEAVAPREVQQLRRELDRAVAKVADMRIELNELERRNDTTELQRELDREIANRRTVERRYQDLVEAESAWKEQAARLDREVNSSKPELRRLRELLTQLETENAKLEVAKKQKEEELRIMRLDSAANLDRLVANLNDAEKELALWRQRCDALQAEKELARRSYQTNEEALTLRLSRTERKLFEVTQGRGVVAAALRSGSSGVTGTGRERSSSPRSRSHGSDATSSAFAVPNVSSQDARVKRLTASSSAEDLRSLSQRLESTEAALRERTMQLAQALGVPRKSAP